MNQAATDDTRAVQLAIAQLEGLADDPFREAVAKIVMDPQPAHLEALRSPGLVARTEAACEFLIRTNASRVRHVLAGDAAAQKRHAVSYFINKVAYERSICQRILAEADARKGIIKNRSNPRARALKRLAQLNLKGDVPQGMYRQLLEEEREADVERRRQERRAAKERAKELRRSGPRT